MIKKFALITFLVSVLFSFCDAQIKYYVTGGYTITNAPLKKFNEFIGLYNENPKKISGFVFSHGFEEMKSLHGFYFGAGANFGNKLLFEINHTSKFNHTFAYYDPANNPNYLRVDLGFGIYTTELALLLPLNYGKFSIAPGMGMGFLNRKLYYWDDEVLERAPKKDEMIIEYTKKSFSLDPMLQISYRPFEGIPLEFVARTYYQAMFSRMSVGWLGHIKGYWDPADTATKRVTGGNLGVIIAVNYYLPNFRNIKLPKRQPKPVVSEVHDMVIKGKVIDISTGLPVDAVITFYIENKPASSFITVDGNYSLNSAQFVTYSIETKAFGYQTKTESLTVSSSSVNPLIHDIRLAKIPMGQAMKLENILFKKASSEMLPESYPELDKLYNFLKSNPSVEIEVSGHTSSEGNDDYNMKLSQDRANSIATYLVMKGINKSRITAKGYGETKPLASNETEDGRKLNRRVEFKITKQ